MKAPSDPPRGACASARDRHHTLVRDSLQQYAQCHDGIDAAACGSLFLLIDTVSLLRRRLLDILAQHRLSEAKFFALIFLRRLAPQTTTPAELAYHTGISRSAMTETLDQMEAEGWVNRERTEVDRRTIQLRLRDDGRGVVDGAVAELMAEVSQLVSGFDPTLSEQLPVICRVLRARVEPNEAPAAP